MNWMALITTIFGVTTILAAYVAVIFRDRAHELEIQDDALLAGQRKVIREQRAHINRVQRTIDDHVDAVDAMNDCNAELERRNAWLEQRRHLILLRWWRRPANARRLGMLRIQKGYGQ